MKVYHCGCFLLSCLLSAGVWVLDESELSVLQTDVLLYEMLPFSCLSTHSFCLPHCWRSCSLLPVIFLSEILLCDIASPWYRSYFVSLFQNWAQRTCARAFRSSMPTFISRLQISYRLVGKKLQIRDIQRWEWLCEHNLICTFSKYECGINLNRLECAVSVWNIFLQWVTSTEMFLFVGHFKLCNFKKQ